MGQRMWITWESQRRNRELSKVLDARLFEFCEIDRITNRFRKYLTGIIKTTFVVYRERPCVIFGQNPSLILSLFLICLRPMWRFKVIIDAHNAGIYPAEGRSKILMILSRFVQRHADLVIITNTGMKKEVEANGGKSVVLPDKIPDIPHRRKVEELAGTINFLFICSYAADEPYDEVIKVAEDLPEGIVIYISGNYRKAGILPEEVPANVRLTGFLSMEDFESLLHSVDATIDLTARENCLVCGAYESVAAGKPMVLSDTEALREYFHSGAIYTNHSVSAIRNALVELVARKDELTAQVEALRQDRSQLWNKQFQVLEQQLRKL